MSETDQWRPVVPPACDICWRQARWAHSLGGLRCESCPRPEVKLFGIYDPTQNRWWPRWFTSFEKAKAHYDRCRGPGSCDEIRELPTSPLVSELHNRRE